MLKTLFMYMSGLELKDYSLGTLKTLFKYVES